MRTPHGDADVSIVSHAPTTTIGDVVSAVTGQAIPRLVLIDDRAVDATTLLDDVQLVAGAVVTTEPSIPPVISITDAGIVQIAGHGAGRVMRLGPGRYRIGPGRRSSAEELDVGPVERTVLELVVDPTAAASEVTVVPEVAKVPEVAGVAKVAAVAAAAEPEVTLDGTALTAARRWHQGTLTVGPRAFQLDNPARSEVARSLPEPDRDGTVAFSRPPRRPSAPARRPVVDAVHDAMLAATTLWERRPNHPDAFVLPIGVRADSADIVNADLSSDRAVAVTGSERFRGALARTLVVEATTLHGPCDLELVVLTDPGRVAQWDWAKWLPHLRIGGPPAIWSSPHDITRWAHGAGERAASTTSPRMSSHLTIVILDDPGLWNRRDSPLRSIVSNPPDDLRLIALCDDATQAPAACTTLISETADGLARLHSFTRADDGGAAVRAALTETAVAVRVARALAPLADVELPETSPAAPSANDRVELSELLGVTERHDILDRWTATESRPTVAIGRRGHESIEVPVADDVTVFVGSSMGDAFDVAATSLIGQCVDRSPDAMWIAPMMLEHGSRSELLWKLPHATDPHDLTTTIEPRRLLARLRTVLAEPEGPDRIVLVAEAANASRTSPDETWLAALAVGVRATSGLAMVVVTDRSDMTHVVGDTAIRVERRDEIGRSDTRRVASVLTLGITSQTFTPLQRTTPPIPLLELRPYVVGRALTPLERRIEQHRAQSANSPEPQLAAAVTLLREAESQRRGDVAPDARRERAVVPPPMPSRVDLVELFDTSPGDGVPLGLVDDPSTAGVRTRWWEPGNGSLLVFGSRRSGVEQTLATILLGIVDRFSALDVRLVVIEDSSTRRRALNGIDHAIRLVAPDQAGELVEALDEIAAELDRCAATSTSTHHDGPRMVVLIGDLVHLRRRYADQPLGTRIDEMLTTAAGAGGGIDVIAYAADLNGAGPFATVAPSRLVGASSDHDELLELGVEHPSELEGIVGRCRSFPGADLVQLAIADATTETLLARRSNGGHG